MNKMTKLIISLAFVFSTPLAFSCDYPPPPKDLPDGGSSSKEDMIAGVKSIAAYQENMSEYLSCIEADEVVAKQAMAKDDEKGKEQRDVMFNKKYNAAVDEQARTVEQFNAEIREYKARTK